MGLVIIALIIINIFTVYKFIFKFIFTDFDDFNESLRYSFTPDIISLFRKEYWKDQFGEFKLGFFILICVIVTIVEYGIVNGIIQQIMKLI
ncbi:hypothetical protein NE686_12040 [Tissierella carlieri]|uniref:Uncharacterized protein n=1 Tax=Tissierella carlieri TaxID=689904 RepID=A0ABT1SCY0_9FIRM|nr:hypothetical protein [Tissierella carlieri]MCQ4923822.1 hypothetical protein [Tissierella carlieri]